MEGGREGIQMKRFDTSPLAHHGRNKDKTWWRGQLKLRGYTKELVSILS